MRDVSARLSLAGTSVVTGLIFGAGTLVWLPLGRPGTDGLRIGIAVGAGALFGLAMLAFVILSWRSHGGREAVAERSRAVRSGVLPASADEAWLPGLRARRQNAVQLPWVLPFLTVLMLGLGLSRLHDRTPLAAGYWFVLAAVLLILAMYRITRRSRDVAVLDRFIARLQDDRDPGRASTTPGDEAS